MPTLFPGAIDTFNNPSPSVQTNDPTVGHASQHANANDAIRAIETEIGVTISPEVGTIRQRLARVESRQLRSYTLIGVVDGLNDTFVSPSSLEGASYIVMVNGIPTFAQLYEDNVTFTFGFAPTARPVVILIQ